MPTTNEPKQQTQQPGAGPPQGLPPTGLQRQLASLQQQYSTISSLGQGLGFNPQIQQFSTAQAQAPGGVGLPQPATQGSTSLQQLANRMAQSYGLSIGRANLFDAAGNPLMTPEQVAQASGGAETMGTAAAKMGFIADALARQQTMESQEKGIETLQAGIGQVQSRARGSLAALQSGLYQQMAAQYANQEYEAADFSFYIQREQQLIEQELQRKAEKRAKRGGILGAVAGVAGLVAAPFTGGATLGIAATGLSQAMQGWI